MAKLPPKLHRSSPRRDRSGSTDVRPTGSSWQKQRTEVLKQHPLCVYCLPIVRASEVVDHIIALALGGKTTPANLIGACRDCNSIKAKLEQQWSAAGWSITAIEHAVPIAGTLPWFIYTARAALK